MNRRLFVSSLLFASLVGLSSSCASGGGIRTADYDRRVTQQVQIGMSKENFSLVFPEAVARGARAYEDGVVEALEVVISDYSFFPSGAPNRVRNEVSGVESAQTWFYFFDDQLVQYGYPEDWPTNPDRVIEIRNRFPGVSR